jgi:hypothetical protein
MTPKLTIRGGSIFVGTQRVTIRPCGGICHRADRPRATPIGPLCCRCEKLPPRHRCNVCRIGPATGGGHIVIAVTYARKTGGPR